MTRTVVEVSNQQIRGLAQELAERVEAELGERSQRLYGVPRGGIPVAYAMAYALESGREWVDCEVVDDPVQASLIVDDIEDSGQTRAKYKALYPTTPFRTLLKTEDSGVWYVFPWESSEAQSAEDIPTRLIQYIGEDVTREGLRETPRRFLAAWKYWTGGYDCDPSSLLKVFIEGADEVDEMIFIGSIPFVSHCEHHLAQFTGLVHVGYVPDGKLIGLSKIPRLVDMFARRLQVQERLTTQIATTLHELVIPLGVGVVIQATHSCINSRGVCVHGTTTTTSKVIGCMKEKPEARSEFLKFVELEVTKK